MDQSFDEKDLLLKNQSEQNTDEDSLISALQKNDKIPFHMPGHKRNGKFNYLFGTESIDVTEIEGTDNLHNPQGILKVAMQNAADFYQVKEVRFLVNGSTCGILAGIRTLTHRGDKVIVARNCHKSVYNAIDLLGLEPVYILPEQLEEYGIYGSIDPDCVAKLLDKTNAKLVIITSPTYEGILSDIQSIANICHEREAVLFVDEAHGAHLGLNRLFKKSARQLGADIVVNSLHKTMPSLTQTAILHVCTDSIDLTRLDESLAMFETSSPSYVLMSSIDGCIRYSQNTPDLFYKWAMRVEAIREELKDNKYINIFYKSILSEEDKQKVFDIDETKLVFITNKAGLSGIEFVNKMRDKYNIELEMASANYAIAMTGAGDSKESLETLRVAIKELDRMVIDDTLVRVVKLPQSLPKKAFNPSEIDGLNTEYANMLDSIDRVSVENIWAYPPGTPILVKGEIMSKEVAEYLLVLIDNGVEVMSSLRDFPNTILVVK